MDAGIKLGLAMARQTLYPLCYHSGPSICFYPHPFPPLSSSCAFWPLFRTPLPNVGIAVFSQFLFVPHRNAISSWAPFSLESCPDWRHQPTFTHFHPPHPPTLALLQGRIDVLSAQQIRDAHLRLPRACGKSGGPSTHLPNTVPDSRLF